MGRDGRMLKKLNPVKMLAGIRGSYNLLETSDRFLFVKADKKNEVWNGVWVCYSLQLDQD